MRRWRTQHESDEEDEYDELHGHEMFFCLCMFHKTVLCSGSVAITLDKAVLTGTPNWGIPSMQALTAIRKAGVTARSRNRSEVSGRERKGNDYEIA